MHLKIVVDVIKDTASTGGGRRGACYGSDLSKENGFHWLLRLCAPSGCHMTCRHGSTGKRERSNTCTRSREKI